MEKQDSKIRVFPACLLFLITIFISSSFSYFFWSDFVTSWYPNGDTTVCITATGEKYHRKSCSYLRYSSFDIPLEDAVERGYGKCSRCNPPNLVSLEEYKKHKTDQNIFLNLILVSISSIPLSFVVFLVIAKINDFIGFLNNFPDWVFLALIFAIYISVFVQGFRIITIW